MVEELKPTPQSTMTVQELVEEKTRLPLVAPFVSGTPCLTPDGQPGHIVSGSLFLEGPDGRGGTRKYIASDWEEARRLARRGAALGSDSTLRVRSQGAIRRFPAGEVRIVVRRDVVVPDED